MLDPNIKLARQPGFSAFIRELAEEPLNEVNAKLGTRRDADASDMRRSTEPAPHKFIPALLPLPIGSGSQPSVTDRRLRMLADTRNAFTAFEMEADDSSERPIRSDGPLTHNSKDNAPQAHGPEGMDAAAPQQPILRSPAQPKETIPENIVDPELQSVLLSLAKASPMPEAAQVSTARTVVVSIVATLLVMAAAWAAVRLL